MTDVLKLLTDIVPSLDVDDLVKLGDSVKRSLATHGQDYLFCPKQDVLGPPSGSLPDLSALAAKPSIKPGYWMKLLCKGGGGMLIDTSKDNGYAFTGPFVRWEDAEKFPAGDCIVVGYADGNRGVREVVAMRKTHGVVTTLPVLRANGKTDIREFAGYQVIATGIGDCIDLAKKV